MLYCGKEVHPSKEDIRLFDETEALDFSRVRVHADDVITKDNGDKIKSLKRDLEPSVHMIIMINLHVVEVARNIV